MKIKLLLCLMVSQSAMLLGMEPDKSGNNVVEGKVCIIPKKGNMRYLSLEPYEDGSYEKTLLEYVFGIPLTNNELLVDIWACTDESDTWSSSYSNLFCRVFLKTHPKYVTYLEGVKKLKNLGRYLECSKESLDKVGKEGSREAFDKVFLKTHPKYKKYSEIVKKLKRSVSYYYYGCQLGIEDEVSANTFPNSLPLKLLRKKEGDTIEFNAFGLPVRLKCDQLTSPYKKGGCYNDTPMSINNDPMPFHEVLQKSIEDFVKMPNYFLDEDETLIEKGFLVKIGNARGHGPNGFRNKPMQESQQN